MDETNGVWWRKLLEAKGMSQQKLAAEAGVSPATVNRMVNGRGRPDVGSVRKVARVLTDGDTDLIWAMIGTGHRDFGDFDLSEVTDELSLLSPAQRSALLAVVRSMADPMSKRPSEPQRRRREQRQAGRDVIEADFGAMPPVPGEDAAAAHDPGTPSQGERARGDQDAGYDIDQDRDGR